MEETYEIRKSYGNMRSMCNGLFKCILGRRTYLRSGANINGKD